MKPPVSTETRQTVIELRRCHSISQVSEQTGLPVGTVKTICHRSGLFRDNAQHRALFSLPPIQTSSQTLPAIAADLPEQKAVTGDHEIDAVLWLREVIGTGQAALIDRAMLAAQKIKTPLPDLEKRYREHLVSANPGHWGAGLFSFGFGDLDSLAKQSIHKLTRRNEAMARFGDAGTLFAETDAEQFCLKTLKGLKTGKHEWRLDGAKVAARFKACPEFMPNTLSDCLAERYFWHELYALRDAEGGTGAGDMSTEATAREDFAFACLAKIRPRNKAESVAVLHYLAKGERMEREETNDILLNLLA